VADPLEKLCISKLRVIRVSPHARTLVSPFAGRGRSSLIPRTTLWHSSEMVLYRKPPLYLGGRLVTRDHDLETASRRGLMVAASGGGRPSKVFLRKGTRKGSDSTRAWDSG